MDEDKSFKREAKDTPPNPKRRRIITANEEDINLKHLDEDSDNDDPEENAEELKDMIEQLIPLLISPACRIKSINLEENYFNDEILVSLSKAIAVNTSLTRLSLSNINGMQFSQVGILALAAAIKPNNTLKILIINDIASKRKLCEIIPFLASNQTLIHLSINNHEVDNPNDDPEFSCGIEKEGAFTLKEILLSNNALKKLELERNNLGEVGIAHIAEVFSKNTPLEDVSLGNNNIGDQGAVILANSLKTNTTLKILDLSDNNIGNRGADALIELLKTNRTLTKLTLDGNDEINQEKREIILLRIKNNNLIESEMAYFSNIFSNNASLEEVSFGYNIGDQGAIILANSLKTNTKLKILDLSSSNISDVGINAFIELFKTNTTLIELKLGKNNAISKEKREEIEKIMSNRKEANSTTQTQTLPRASEFGGAFLPSPRSSTSKDTSEEIQNNSSSSIQPTSSNL